MWEIKECACDPAMPDHKWRVVDVLTGISVCFFDPDDSTVEATHLKKRDAQRLCNVLNGYLENFEKAAKDPRDMN